MTELDASSDVTIFKLVWAATFVCLLIVASCAPEKEGATRRIPGEPMQAKVAVNASLKSAPILIAQEKGWFADTGLQVKLDVQPSVAYLMDQLMAGESDLVTIPEYQVVDYSFKTRGFTIVAVLNRNRSRKIVANSDFIRESSDFAGTSMGIASDSALGYTLYRFFLHNGISKDSVRLVYKKPAELAEALATGEVQSILAWPPYTIDAERRIAPKALYFDAHLALDMYWVLVARTEWLNDNYDTVFAFLESIERSYRFMDKDKAGAALLISRILGYEVSEVLTEWKDYYFSLEMPQSLFLSLEQQATWKNANIEGVEHIPDYSQFVNGALIRKLDPERPNVY